VRRAVSFLQVQNELMEAMKAETFYEGDNPLSFTDKDHAFVAMIEQETQVQKEAEQRRSTVLTDFEGLPFFLVSSVLRCLTVNLFWAENSFRGICCMNLLQISYAWPGVSCWQGCGCNMVIMRDRELVFLNDTNYR